MPLLDFGGDNNGGGAADVVGTEDTQALICGVVAVVAGTSTHDVFLLFPESDTCTTDS